MTPIGESSLGRRVLVVPHLLGIGSARCKEAAREREPL
jgi:hypothetical protein